MPRYRPLTIEGLLMMDDQQLVLQNPDGGEWRVRAISRYDHLLGRRVRVEGIREGHDIVAAERITSA